MFKSINPQNSKQKGTKRQLGHKSNWALEERVKVYDKQSLNNLLQIIHVT